jgi:hypothetical protein
MYTMTKHKNKTVFMSHKQSFSGPRKGRNPDTDVSVLEYLKELRNKGLPVTKEALMTKTK